MNMKKFSDAMSELDTKYIDEALNYKKYAQKPILVKWGAIAACLCFVTVVLIIVPSIFNSREINDQMTGGISNEDQNISENAFLPTNIHTMEVTYWGSSGKISRELSQNEIKAVKKWITSLKWDKTPLNKADTPNNDTNIIRWNFNINNGELNFSYVNCDTSAIFIDNKWYAVKNPSNPPVDVK